MKFLKAISCDYEYGPDKIKFSEMIQYAIGDGYVYGSYWDNGRKPMMIITQDDYENLSKDEKDKLYPFILRKFQEGPRLKLSTLPGAKALKSGVFYYEISTTYNSNLDTIYQYCFVGYSMDGSDLVFLRSEASGELPTLLMNCVINWSLQDVMINLLKDSTKLALFLKFVSLSVVEDDGEVSCRWLSLPDIDEHDVDHFLKIMSEGYAEMGHELSLEKTFITPYSAEFVQTFSRFGVYLPKDQIMMISSEKPRRITDVMGFLSSFKRLLLTKISRGYNEKFSIILMLFHSFILTRFDLRMRDVKISKTKFHDMRRPT